MERKYMGLQLHIPDSVVQAIRLPEGRKSRELLIELSIALYSQDFYLLARQESWLIWGNMSLDSCWENVESLDIMDKKSLRTT
jgi:hypothetical protein